MAPSTYSDALRALLSPLTSDQWVQCDSCEIWRRVPKRIADALGDDEQWCARLVSSRRVAPARSSPSRSRSTDSMIRTPRPPSLRPSARSTPVPTRPRSRGERRSIRTLPSSDSLVPRPSRAPSLPLPPPLRSNQPRFCNLNPYDYFNRCDAPQEIEDDEIDVVLQAQAAAEEYKLAAVERAAAEKAEKAAAAAAAAAREHVSYNMSVTDGNQTRRQFQARSIHWSPYDRVGVVNADP